MYTPSALAPKAAVRHIRLMTSDSLHKARLNDRAVIAVTGDDWRGFLQGLLTQDVETLAPGELRFAGLLSPPGRLLYDLFLFGREDGCWIDCAAAARDELAARLNIYRLRAKVTIAPLAGPVHASWGGELGDGWTQDPRLPDLGYRRYDEAGAPVSRGDYRAHRLSLGIPGAEDWGADKTYPIEANFDLLHGIDFKKGCFVGQETTSRMKRRGVIKTRMAPVTFDGAAPDAGAELLAGDLRAGEVTSSGDGVAMALLRLDRLESGARTYAGGAWRPALPAWLAAEVSIAG